MFNIFTNIFSDWIIIHWIDNIYLTRKKSQNKRNSFSVFPVITNAVSNTSVHRHFRYYVSLCCVPSRRIVGKGYKPFQSFCWSLSKFPSLFQGTLFCDSLKDSYWLKERIYPSADFSKKKIELKFFYIIDNPHAKVQPASFIPEGKLTSNQSANDMLCVISRFPQLSSKC